jgi:hypothetical protein
MRRPATKSAFYVLVRKGISASGASIQGHVRTGGEWRTLAERDCECRCDKAATCGQKDTVVRGAAMMQTWAEYLDELRDAGKVIPLRREMASS